MMNTLARIKKTGKNFEIIVDLDNALKFKKGETNFIEAEGDKIFTDSKKGFVPPASDLKEAFGTADISEIVKKIVKEGEVLLTQDHRDAEQEKKFKQIVDFLSKNTIDPKTGNPHPIERIKNALEQSQINIKKVSIENQIKEIIDAVSKIIPIKVETKKIRIIIPAMYTGKAYGLISQHKEQEEWLSDGSLRIIVKIPAGMVIDFYDKLNSVTHGAALTEEIKEE
ncbi:MAG: ribosome assembly factor SBDS [archaeon]